MKRAPIQIQKMNRRNHLWLFIPTQLLIQGQWWSIFITHCRHKEQWCPLIGFGSFQGLWGSSSSGTGHSHFLHVELQFSKRVEYLVFLYFIKAAKSFPTPAGFKSPVFSSSFKSTFHTFSSVYLKETYIVFGHESWMGPHCFEVRLDNTKQNPKPETDLGYSFHNTVLFNRNRDHCLEINKTYSKSEGVVKKPEDWPKSLDWYWCSSFQIPRFEVSKSSEHF